MKKFYKIHNDYAEIVLSKNIYPLVCVKKALVNFMEMSYIKLGDKGNKIIIQIALKDLSENLEIIVGEFYNELLRESLRYNIASETKNLRELIVGRALYTTCIDLDDNIEKKNDVIEDDYNLEDIAVNWFEKYEDKGI